LDDGGMIVLGNEEGLGVRKRNHLIYSTISSNLICFVIAY
jgi:hypothetical protein